MTMRFDNGYRLFTNSATTVGVILAGGGNAWSTISDVHKKENFEAVDEEIFLQKISAIPLTTWNYKGQEPSRNRHYGPMAQDFYAAFGKDEYGTIGNDTTINQADFDGINFIGVYTGFFYSPKSKWLCKRLHKFPPTPPYPPTP